MGALQASQIVEQLARCDWLAVPKDKDHVKLDLNAMDDAKEIKKGSSRKWVLREEKA